MRKIVPTEFSANVAWGACDIERINDASIRLHWTDAPYIWHINDGPEVFVVLDGQVDMHTRQNGQEQIVQLNVGDIFHARDGDAHMAHPRGVARVLVIEQAGSV
ncbi:cupin [Aliisedimentitalea scapharcae]|uniref:Cupin n=1 Tax=Aliisedimentitalea scapharcae TaxID=1524259 RepID=A0ABZ2XZ14_9RHOB|nr:cupin [Rhodobacteraceae bacterium M382]